MSKDRAALPERKDKETTDGAVEEEEKKAGPGL